MICLIIHHATAQELNPLKVAFGEYIFQVRADKCEHGQAMGTTGFISREHQGIITALHGVVGCETIAIINTQHLFTGLSLHAVDFYHDVALLTSPKLKEFLQNNPSAGLRHFTNYGDIEHKDTLTSLGYPFGISQLIDEDIRFRPALDNSFDTPLSNLIPPRDIAKFRDCLSPSTDENVYALAASVRPGESGAPILDDNGYVVGIVMGGLQEGGVNIAWATQTANVTLHTPAKYEIALANRARHACSTNRFSQTDTDEAGLQDALEDINEIKRDLEQILQRNQSFLEQNPRARAEYFASLDSALFNIRMNDLELFQQAKEALANDRIEDFNIIIDNYANKLAAQVRELELLAQGIREMQDSSRALSTEECQQLATLHNNHQAFQDFLTQVNSVEIRQLASIGNDIHALNYLVERICNAP